MFLPQKEHRLFGQHTTTIVCCIALTMLAAFASFVYRGIYPDDLPRYSRWAEAVFSHKGLGSDDPDSIASILFHALIALAYKLLGKDLLAAHFFPYVFATITPMVMFLLLRQILKHSLWACLGSIAYMLFPTNFIWTNQPLTEPIFLFWLIVTMWLVELSKTRHAFLVLVGIAAALMSFARLFDGLLYATLAGLSIIIQHRQRFPVKWMIGAILGFLGTHIVASLLFEYSLLQYYDYYCQMLHYPYENTSSMMKTMTAIKIFMRWYFGLFTPVFLGVIVVGFIDTLRKNIVFPALCLSGYAGFILLLYQGRYVDTFDLRLGVKMIPSLIVLLISGVKWGYDRLLARKTQRDVLAAYVFLAGMVTIFCITSIQKNRAFVAFMSDIIPSSSFSSIIRHRPVYEQAQREAALFAQDPDFVAKAFREAVIKVVRGAYRLSYRSKIAEKAWKNRLPELDRRDADFSYYDAFTNGEQWKKAAFHIEGTSTLWTAAHPDRIGAFPSRTEGTVIYKFTFPQHAQKITISDVHTQWEPNDVVRMWISYNGHDWVLQYDDDLRYKKTYYHHELEYIPANASELYVKYYFFAGDASRANDDNRGASLEQFSLAVTCNRAE